MPSPALTPRERELLIATLDAMLASVKSLSAAFDEPAQPKPRLELVKGEADDG